MQKADLQLGRAQDGAFWIEAKQWFNKPRDQVFPFFANALNLETITPDWLKFEVLTPRPIMMKRGLLIDNRLKVHGFPLRWQSKISAWEPPVRFVDEQRRGPYRVWHHEHLFEEDSGGTLVIDRVRYRVFGGALINTLFVKKDVTAIFKFRQKKLAEVFQQ